MGQLEGVRSHIKSQNQINEIKGGHIDRGTHWLDSSNLIYSLLVTFYVSKSSCPTMIVCRSCKTTGLCSRIVSTRLNMEHVRLHFSVSSWPAMAIVCCAVRSMTACYTKLNVPGGPQRTGSQLTYGLKPLVRHGRTRFNLSSARILS